MRIEDFYNLHKGETCIIAGVGPNLHLTPPQWFNYPSFSVNTIYKYEGWTPKYYVGVDERLRLEDGEALTTVYKNVTKFFPTPDWDELQGENIYRFKHTPRGDLTLAGQMPNSQKALTDYGITYRRVMDAVFQIAWHMGFTTMLMIGVQHKPYDEKDSDRAHFWGIDTKAVPNQPNTWWFDGYSHFSRTMNGVRLLNISADTYVPDDVLKRDDWQKWKNT